MYFEQISWSFSLSLEVFSPPTQRQVDDDSPHHAPLFKIGFGAVGVVVVAVGAGFRNGNIRINRLKIPAPFTRNDPGERLVRMLYDFFQSQLFILRSGRVVFVDGPEAHQPVFHADPTRV